MLTSTGEPKHGSCVNSLLGNQCLYLLSPAHGKSTPVWRDSLCADCALDCLICVEVAVDLKGPLLLWSWDPVWKYSSPANRDWHESDLRMFYSVSGPLSLPQPLHPHWGSVWFPIDSKVYNSIWWAFPRRARDPQLNSHKRSNMWLTSDKWQGFYIILRNACCQTLKNMCLHFPVCL